MASGSTLTVAKGWFVSDAKDLLVVEDPERQSKLAMVELAAADRDAAVARAWERFQPGFALKVAHKEDLLAREGWDEVARFVYVTQADDNRAVQAVVRRKGSTWYAWLVDASKAAFDRRSGHMMMALRSFKPVGLMAESFAGRAAHPFDAAKQQALSTFVEQARKDVDIPGVAIGIVQGGKLVYEKAFGVKDRDDKKAVAVAPATLFLIGSNTKSLTTLLMARLIDRGVFAWTTPVTQLWPTFALGDAAMTRTLTMQHTVCACTGLPRYDMQFLFEYAGVTPEDRVTSMKTMMPTTGFGETFQYSNLMVAAGGFVAAHASAPANKKKALGPAYDDAMQTEVFRPLGMRATTFDFATAARANHAAPHAQALDAGYRRVPLSWEEGVLAVRPAGGAWSNVRDMSRYLLVELGKGVTPEGKRVVSEANVLHRREAQVKMSDKASYGLGLMVTSYHGVSVVQHGGNNVGFSSDM
jgi:CubicO group peptidase (beta-lactamase class C family)